MSNGIGEYLLTYVLDPIHDEITFLVNHCIAHTLLAELKITQDPQFIVIKIINIIMEFHKEQFPEADNRIKLLIQSIRQQKILQIHLTEKKALHQKSPISEWQEINKEYGMEEMKENKTTNIDVGIIFSPQKKENGQVSEPVKHGTKRKLKKTKFDDLNTEEVNKENHGMNKDTRIAQEETNKTDEEVRVKAEKHKNKKTQEKKNENKRITNGELGVTYPKNPMRKECKSKTHGTNKKVFDSSCKLCLRREDYFLKTPFKEPELLVKPCTGMAHSGDRNLRDHRCMACKQRWTKRKFSCLQINTCVNQKFRAKETVIHDVKNKRNCHESIVTEELMNRLGGNVRREVVVPGGRIDLMTEEEIIEVKEASGFKSAVGQILFYQSQLLPKKYKMRVHLFNSGRCDKKMILDFAALHDVQATFEEEVVKDDSNNSVDKEKLICLSYQKKINNKRYYMHLLLQSSLHLLQFSFVLCFCALLLCKRKPSN